MRPSRAGMSVERRGDVVVVSGAICEARSPGAEGLLSLLSRAQGGRLVLDLAGVARIDSLAVRAFPRLQAAAQRAGIALELRRLAEPLIRQLNTIGATRGAARVTSFFAPYACDACEHEASLLVDAIAHAAGLARLEPPAMVCPVCGAAMAFNDFPERYFSFLSV